MKPAALIAKTADRARRLKACLAADSRLVAELAFWRLSLPLLKRIVGVETLAAFMTPPAEESPVDGQRRARIDIVHRVVTTGGRLLVSPNCLERSLVLGRLLSRAGAPVSLVLGMRRDGSALAAHAWLEVDGLSLDDPPDNGFTPIVAFRAQSRRPPDRAGRDGRTSAVLTSRGRRIEVERRSVTDLQPLVNVANNASWKSGDKQNQPA